MPNKISIITIYDENKDNMVNLINSFNSQDYSEKELLVLADEVSDFPENIKVFNHQDSFESSFRLLLENSSGRYILFMHPNEYFSENTVLSELISKFDSENAQALVFSYMTLTDGIFYFHNFGDKIKLEHISPKSLPFVISQNKEFRKWTGIIFSKELLLETKLMTPKSLYICLSKAKNIVFDTKAYYVIPTNLPNSLEKTINSEVYLPQYVKKEVSIFDKAESEIINIAICLDNKYGKYLSPLLYSLNQHHEEINVYLLYEKLDSSVFSLILELNDVLTHLNIKMKKIPKYMITQIANVKNVYTGLPTSTYYRLFIPELFPQLNRVIYMDIDMIVLKRLDELYYTPFEGNYLVAIHDLPMVKQHNMWASQLLGQYYKGYFQAGLLLMNLYLMRKNNTLPQLLEFINENYQYLKYDDQDALNIFYRGAVKYFPYTYNWMAYNYHFYNEKLENLAIVHYAGGALEKPWKNHSSADKKTTILKNIYRAIKLNVDHLLNRQPNLTIFTDYTGDFHLDKHKIESILMQIEANMELYILYDDKTIADYLLEYDQLSPYIHLVATNGESNLKVIKNILDAQPTDYVYCLFGSDYLEEDDVFLQLTSIAEDNYADFVFSSYRYLVEKNSNFQFYEVDDSLTRVASNSFSSFQREPFAKLNSLQGILVRYSRLMGGLNQEVSNEKDMIDIILADNPIVYYKDSHYWVHRV